MVTLRESQFTRNLFPNQVGFSCILARLDRIREVVRSFIVQGIDPKEIGQIEAKHGSDMDNRRMVGPGAAVLKYDILTALTVFGLNGSKADQLSMSRLVALITARYNWTSDSLTIGQREMSFMWGVGERTAKREVKRWLDSGLLLCTRPGVRGRVAKYRLNLPRLCDLTSNDWKRVGTDFEERMKALAPENARVVSLETVRATLKPVDPQHAEDPWGRVLAVLERRYPAQYAAWIAPLRPHDEGKRLILDARSVFAAEYVKTHFGRDIADAVASEWDRELTVAIRGVDQRRIPK